MLNASRTSSKTLSPVTLPPSVQQCPMDSLLRLLSGPWTSYIIWVLHQKPERFGELKRKVGGVSAKMLTERLRLLEEAGVIYREYKPTVPPQVTYGITPRGAELCGVFEGLNAIAQKWAKLDGRNGCPKIRKSRGKDSKSRLAS